MDREELIKIIQENTMDSSEVAKYLGISKSRVSNLNRDKKLVAVKKGIYLKMDVEERKKNQEDLRKKFLRP
ncbi:helix-turn-helix domain-containing protein [Clostridium sporogenes]|uniref:helix-turn-helix domain-containing protein n=1 Tax=Clostridium sporogenes TaxID=1509 RepID=UPI000717AB2E|nr:helix-turn-helix domain-containing protein [Clostridium sporogenes]KRU40023.1 helix-turn-helix domain-containing protein [Clostridium sporogenes]MBY7065162.1 helix-turn-helix domain-containing protein [Clostridium sporogenes]MBY7071792.1 helix-turn-helix domain-containing protein [Clostridium sporogenes]MCW6064768.1 helix-turn-helix domain-containing protein [Clostridium sporogenes]OQP88579.1 helix-turn-helix domain-containing protein [Clostridium sporogenes]